MPNLALYPVIRIEHTKWIACVMKDFLALERMLEIPQKRDGCNFVLANIIARTATTDEPRGAVYSWSPVPGLDNH
jgi:hypothetical protein